MDAPDVRIVGQRFLCALEDQVIHLRLRQVRLDRERQGSGEQHIADVAQADDEECAVGTWLRRSCGLPALTSGMKKFVLSPVCRRFERIS